MVESTRLLPDCLYFPSAFSGFEYKELMEREELVKRIKSDLKVLGKECYETSFKEKLGKGRHKICILQSEYLKDFHFLRLDEDGFWSHKDGWSATPSNRDSWKRKISDPRFAFFGDYKFVTFLRF